MFQVANQRRVWWPVELVQFDPERNEHKTLTVSLLFEIPTRKEARAHEDAVLEKAKAEALAQAERTAAENARREAAGDRGINLPERVAEQTEQLLRGLRERHLSEEAEAVRVVGRTHDWKGFAGEDGEPLPFDRAVLASLCDYEDVRLAVCTAFEAASKGAVRKNSSPGPGGTPGRAQSTRG